MKIVKLTIVLIMLFGATQASEAQQVVAEIGRTVSTFDYKNSEGGTLDNLFPSAHLAFSLGYRRPLSDRLFYGGNLLFNHYGARGSNPIYQARYDWDVQYLGLGVGVDAELFRKGGLAALVRVAAEPQMMITGSQTINEEIYDLRGVEQFDRPFMFFKGSVGLNYCTDSKAVVTMRYAYGQGSPLGKSTDEESLNLITSTISIGLLWNLSNCKYCHERRLR